MDHMMNSKISKINVESDNKPLSEDERAQYKKKIKSLVSRHKKAIDAVNLAKEKNLEFIVQGQNMLKVVAEQKAQIEELSN